MISCLGSLLQCIGPNFFYEFIQIVICDSTWEKGPCRAYNYFSVTGVFSATTPKLFSGPNFCVCLRGISHSLPTLTLSLREWKQQLLKSSLSQYDLNDAGIGMAKNTT